MGSTCSGPLYRFRVTEEAKELENKEITVKHVWGGFKEETTAHGIPHVSRAKGACKKIFWLIISLGCLGMLGLQLYLNTTLYLQWQTNVLVSLVPGRELTFPGVTICNINPIKQSMLHLSPELQNLFNSSVYNDTYKVTRAQEIMVSLNDTTKFLLGYNLTEMLLECQYGGETCNESDFAHYFDPDYGNCYLYNSVWNNETLVHSKKSGRIYGLKLTLNVNQDEYIEAMAQGAGARIVIHSNDQMPYPSDDGILASPGQVTSVGIRQVEVTRMGGLYNPCTDLAGIDKTINVYEQFYPVKYSSTGCYNTCYQLAVINTCACADASYPTYGLAFNKASPVEVCSILNETQSNCLSKIEQQYQNNSLNCQCGTPCYEVSYSLEVSNMEWPSEVSTNLTLSNYPGKIDNIIYAQDINDALYSNLLQTEIYFQEFNFEEISDSAAYELISYLSDLGGILGLWVGMSFLSVFEFFELGLDMIMLLLCCTCCRRARHTEKRPGSAQSLTERPVSAESWVSTGSWTTSVTESPESIKSTKPFHAFM